MLIHRLPEALQSSSSDKLEGYLSGKSMYLFCRDYEFGWLTTASNSSPKGISLPLASRGTWTHLIDLHSDRHTYVQSQVIKNKINLSNSSKNPRMMQVTGSLRNTDNPKVLCLT